MKNNPIETLLEKYFQGNTTLAEEKTLRLYFTETPEIPPHLKKYQPLFQFFSAEIEQALDSTFDDAVLEAITDKNPLKVKTSRVRFRSPLYRIAATVALIATIWWFFPVPKTQVQAQTIDWSKYEVTNPEEAFQITYKAYKKVATEINENTQKAVQELDQFDNLTKLIN